MLCVLLFKYFNNATESREINISESFSSELLKKIPEKINFNFHVKPIISDKCFACHGPDEKERKANLRLDTEKGLYKISENLVSLIIFLHKLEPINPAPPVTTTYFFFITFYKNCLN